MIRKISIIGKAPSSRLLAPFADEQMEIWSLSDNFTVLPRWDRWFELHNLQRYKEQYPDYYDWMASLPAVGQEGHKPLYVTKLNGEIPAAVEFPAERIVSQYGRYFTNSISWMTALAIEEIRGSVQSREECAQCELHYYGVDMAQNTEFAHQRPSCEYFLGIARGLGIAIYVPDESDLLKCSRMYAIEQGQSPMDVKLRARQAELTQRKLEAEKNCENWERMAFQAGGALALMDEIANGNGKTETEWSKNRRKQLMMDIDKARAAREEFQRRAHILQGALENLDWCKQWA